jgi:hypothetical protein
MSRLTEYDSPNCCGNRICIPDGVSVYVEAIANVLHDYRRCVDVCGWDEEKLAQVRPPQRKPDADEEV